MTPKACTTLPVHIPHAGHLMSTADRLTGMNYWACMNLAADDKFAGGDYSRLAVELDQMAAKGIVGIVCEFNIS
jgi:hypothetical protein